MPKGVYVRHPGARKAARAARLAAVEEIPDPNPADPPDPIEIETVNAEDDGESLRDKIRRLASKGAAPTPSPSGRKSPTPGVRAEDLGHGVIVPLLALCFLAVPAHARMSESELRLASEPIARILLRHVSALGHLSPDVIDLFALVAVVTSYTRRLQFEAQQRAQLRAQMQGNRGASGPVPMRPPTKGDSANGFAVPPDGGHVVTLPPSPTPGPNPVWPGV